MSSSPPLPPYSATASNPPPPPPPPQPEPTAQSTTQPHLARPVPEINLLLLGSPGVGKSTFISRLPFVRDGRLQPPPPSPSSSSSSYSTTASPSPSNPCTFNVSLFARPYSISLYRSQSALFIDPFPDKIDALILCFAVNDRVSLFNVQKYWKRVFMERYEEVPVMVLGLKRDLRTDRRRRRVDGEERGEEYVCVMPEEGLEAAKDSLCDRYAECSAVTGELMFEVLEDITRMAAGTTTDNGGFSQGDGCVVV